MNRTRGHQNGPPITRWRRQPLPSLRNWTFHHFYGYEHNSSLPSFPPLRCEWSHQVVSLSGVRMLHVRRRRIAEKGTRTKTRRAQERDIAPVNVRPCRPLLFSFTTCMRIRFALTRAKYDVPPMFLCVLLRHATEKADKVMAANPGDFGEETTSLKKGKDVSGTVYGQSI